MKRKMLGDVLADEAGYVSLGDAGKFLVYHSELTRKYTGGATIYIRGKYCPSARTILCEIRDILNENKETYKDKKEILHMAREVLKETSKFPMFRAILAIRFTDPESGDFSWKSWEFFDIDYQGFKSYAEELIKLVKSKKEA